MTSRATTHASCHADIERLERDVERLTEERDRARQRSEQAQQQTERIARDAQAELQRAREDARRAQVEAAELRGRLAAMEPIVRSLQAATAGQVRGFLCGQQFVRTDAESKAVPVLRFGRELPKVNGADDGRFEKLEVD